MHDSSKFNKIRQSVLDSVEKSNRDFRKAIVGFAFLEATCWLAYVTLALLSFSLPLLIGVAAVAVYAMVAGGIVGLKLHIDACTQRMLTAIELLAEPEINDETGEDLNSNH